MSILWCCRELDAFVNGGGTGVGSVLSCQSIIVLMAMVIVKRNVGSTGMVVPRYVLSHIFGMLGHSALQLSSLGCR